MAAVSAVLVGRAATMPDLTFSEIELERNVLGKTKSSETWLDGVVVSNAEQTRMRIPNVQTSQAESVAAAAKARGAEGYDAGHWYHQPVGGRNVRCRRRPPAVRPERAAAKGAVPCVVACADASQRP